MKTIVCLLTTVLAVEGAPAPVTRSPNECAPEDDVCRAELYAARAKVESDPRRRAIDWNVACRAYLAAHAKSGVAQELCAARRMCEASLAIEGLNASTRSSLENARVRLEEREAAVGRPVCGKITTQKPPGRERPRVARTAAPKAEAPRVEAPPVWMTGAVGAVGAVGAYEIAERAKVRVAGVDAEAPRVAEADDAVLTDDGERAIAQSEPMHLAAVAEVPALLPVFRATEVQPREGRLGRGLVIAGGVTLGVGLGLGGAAAFGVARAAAVAREGFELQAAAMDMPLDEAMRRRDAELAREYRGWTAAAIGTAVSGGVAVIVGAALVGVGRRLAKSTETALVPVPGGLALHGRF